MSYKALIALILAAAATGPLGAQVIEIDSEGTAQTYAGPTVFTGDNTVPIEDLARVSKRSSTTSDAIASAALAHGLDPGLLKALAWQESRGRMSAVSSKGALGVMQLMPGTAAELNVNPANELDNIRGGALYLRRQLDRFGGSVPLALAAYNAGPGAVTRFGGIPPYRETQNYVTAILRQWQKSAIKTLATIKTEVAE